MTEICAKKDWAIRIIDIWGEGRVDFLKMLITREGEVISTTEAFVKDGYVGCWNAPDDFDIITDYPR